MGRYALGVIIGCLLGGAVLSVLVAAQDCSNPKFRCDGSATPTSIFPSATTARTSTTTPTIATVSTCLPQKGLPCPTPTALPPTVTPTLIPGAWIEDWSGGVGRWTDGANNPADYCATTDGGLLHSACGQVFSIQHWDQTQPITVTGSVRGQPLTDDPYFCGLVILQDGFIYAQQAVGRDLQPTQFLPHQAGFVWYVDENAHGYYLRSPVDVDSWQAFSITWDGSSTFTGTWNGQLLPPWPHAPLTAPVRIDLQGGPQGPGTCDFGRVVVQGTPFP